MAYTPPISTNISFNFTGSGYTSPAGTNITFEFGGATAISAPAAKFYTKGLGTIKIEIVVYLPAAKFNHQGVGKGALSNFIYAAPGRFNHKAVGSTVYTVYVASPAAKFYHQGVIEYIDNYLPPAFLTDFINMTNARRDKAVSYDKQHAFDMGPVERANVDEGLLVKAWRLRIDGTSAYLAKEERGDWGSEFLEFTLPHSPVFSVDLTFDQNGYPFACWEYSGQVWIYWYNPLTASMETKYVCVGRTPRGRLDGKMRHQIPTSDIYLFYINDSEDVIQYRMQRDKYEVAYDSYTPASVDNLYLEVLATARDYRLYVWISEYLPENEGTHFDAYQLAWIHSAVYPYYFTEKMEVAVDTIPEAKHQVDFILDILDDIDLDVEDDIVDVSVRSVMIPYSMSIIEGEVDDVILDASVREAIETYSMGDVQGEVDDAILDASIRVAIAENTIDPESAEFDADQILSVTKG